PIVSELIQIDVAVDVSSVIKDHTSKPFFKRNRKACFGIPDRQHFASNRYADEATRRRIRRIATHGDRALRTCSVDRKSAQRIRAAGEETLAEWNVAACKWGGEAEPEVVGPRNPRFYRSVQRRLSQKTHEIGA